MKKLSKKKTKVLILLIVILTITTMLVPGFIVAGAGNDENNFGKSYDEKSYIVWGKSWDESQYVILGASSDTDFLNKQVEEAIEQQKQEERKKEEAQKKLKSKTSSNVQQTNYTVSEDIEYLARTIWAEARGESTQGQLAVAEVVLNRLATGKWGSTVKAVVTSKSQFAVGRTFTQVQIDIAKRALSGERVFYNSAVLYFKMSDDLSWHGCSWIAKIGCHSFYAK